MTASIKRFGAGEGDPTASSEIWGGKGAGLMRMAADGLPVPPGFTITTAACNAYKAHGNVLIDAIMDEVAPQLEWLKAHFGYMPLLSVRSGARVSMPGMMDTILNVGISNANLVEWSDRLNPTAALDSYRRLLMMLGDTALGIHKDEFALSDEVELADAITAYEQVYSKHGFDPPGLLVPQLRAAIEAVFKSWDSDRAKEYRKQNKIPDDWGTSVTIQSMVFGNMNDKSGSGVLFSRNPSTGEPGLYGEFLPNAQGEDVVAGTHTPIPVQQMKAMGWGKVYAELDCIAKSLETTRKDMQDMEFTVQGGTLYMLQTRNGKRSAQAAFRIAHDLHDEGLITYDEMLARITREQFKVIKRPQIDPAFKAKPVMTGIAGSMGVAVGKVVFSSEAAVKHAANGPVILVATETTPEDIAGMFAAVGILTKTGGATSHAAVVARGMDKPCVVGCTDLLLPGDAAPSFTEGQVISICGATGRVWAVEAPLVVAMDDAGVSAVLDKIMATRNLLEQSSTPKRHAVIPLADWLSCDDKQLAAHFAAVTEVLKNGDWLMLDTNWKAQPEDDLLWGVVTARPESDRLLEIVKQLCKHDLKGAYATGDAKLVGLLTAAGADDVPTVNDVGQLLGATGMVRLSWQMTHALGGDQAMKIVLSSLKATGHTEAHVMSTALPKNYAAFVALGEAAAA